MLQFIRYVQSLGVILCVGLMGVTPVQAEGARHAAMILDANSGKVLHAAQADELRYPASLTKLMTIYMAFEEIAKGNLTLDSRIKVSAEAESVAPSKLGLEAGSTIALADAIKALVTKSANDMAVAIAERIGGTESNFASLMTKRARDIGMRSTVFRNASGLPDRDQLTTARDMITLALRIHDDFPDKVRVFKLREFSFAGKTYRTHNTLMKSFAGMDGMKTGYTKASGFNLVASVRRDGKFVIGAVFGGATASSRNAHMRQILTRAMGDASTEKTRSSKPMLVASTTPAKRQLSKPVEKIEKAEKPIVVASADVEPVVAKPAKIKAPTPAPVVEAKPQPKPAVAPLQSMTVKSPAPTDLAKEATEPVQQALTVSPPAPQFAQSITVAPPIPDATIQVAKVRSVPMPAKPVAIAALAPVPNAEPEAQNATVSSGLDFTALKRAVAALKTKAAAPATPAVAAGGETVVAKGPARNPSTLQVQAAIATVQPAMTIEPSEPARAPSTLNAQAATLVPEQPAARIVLASAQPMHLGVDAGAAAVLQPSAQPVNGGGYAIQIGAFGTAAEAERQIGSVQAKTGATLQGASPFTRAVTSNGRQLFAARFTGFDQTQASNACNELRRQSFDCFVIQAR